MIDHRMYTRASEPNRSHPSANHHPCHPIIVVYAIAIITSCDLVSLERHTSGVAPSSAADRCHSPRWHHPCSSGGAMRATRGGKQPAQLFPSRVLGGGTMGRRATPQQILPRPRANRVLKIPPVPPSPHLPSSDALGGVRRERGAPLGTPVPARDLSKRSSTLNSLTSFDSPLLAAAGRRWATLLVAAGRCWAPLGAAGLGSARRGSTRLYGASISSIRGGEAPRCEKEPSGSATHSSASKSSVIGISCGL